MAGWEGLAVNLVRPWVQFQHQQLEGWEGRGTNLTIHQRSQLSYVEPGCMQQMLRTRARSKCLERGLTANELPSAHGAEALTPHSGRGRGV